MTNAFETAETMLAAEQASRTTKQPINAVLTELSSVSVVVMPATDTDREACKTLLSSAFNIVDVASGLHLTLNNNAELAGRKSDQEDTTDGDDADEDLGVLPTLNVIHDGAGFKIIHRLFAHYVGADGDFRNVMMFMRDVDDLLSKYRTSLGLDASRPVEAGNVDAKQESSLGPDQTRIDKAKSVRKAQKQMEDEAPTGNEVASANGEAAVE